MVVKMWAGLSWLQNRRTEKGNEGSCFQGRHVQALASLSLVPRHSDTSVKAFLGTQGPAT